MLPPCLLWQPRIAAQDNHGASHGTPNPSFFRALCAGFRRRCFNAVCRLGLCRSRVCASAELRAAVVRTVLE